MNGLTTERKPITDQKLAGSIGKNTLFGVIASLFQVGTRLVTVPVVISHLGIAGYGIWSIIITTAAYMRFGSTGSRSAFQKYVAEATGTGDFERASQLLSTGTAAMLILSVAGLVPIVFCSEWLARASGVSAEYIYDTKWAISLFALTMVLTNSGAAYDAIVVGGHRIDIARRFSIVLGVSEAVAMITLLHFGFGLIAMAAVMSLSQLVYLICTYSVSGRIVPRVQIKLKYVSKRVGGELLRFAGSYQLLNFLQLVYGAMVPIAILRSSGAFSSGVFAVVTRLMSPIMMCMYAFLLPILSGGAMVYGSAASETMRRLLSKSFKVTLGITLFPLALICVFGLDIIKAWTGQADASFPATLWLVSLTTLFQSFSLLALVLYRVSGRGLMDVVREILRVVSIAPLLLFPQKFGFMGTLRWVAGAEFVGTVLMLIVVVKTFRAFDLRTIVADALRLMFATSGIIVIAAIAVSISPARMSDPRMVAVVKVAEVALVTLLTMFPAMYLTGAVTKSEARSILQLFKTKSGVTV